MCLKIGEGFGIGEVMRARDVVNLLYGKVAGVSEGLGGGLQRWVCCGNPFMPVRIRPLTPSIDFKSMKFMRRILS